MRIGGDVAELQWRESWSLDDLTECAAAPAAESIAAPAAESAGSR